MQVTLGRSEMACQAVKGLRFSSLIGLSDLLFELSSGFHSHNTKQVQAQMCETSGLKGS